MIITTMSSKKSKRQCPEGSEPHPCEFCNQGVFCCKIKKEKPLKNQIKNCPCELESMTPEEIIKKSDNIRFVTDQDGENFIVCHCPDK